mmetsp:Transcript_5764/g.24288  ORF Transcript_5764/g.24288 Transcript_5764/m.24288 type:complete len:87 (-) Transcript_5764:123-383(-)
MSCSAPRNINSYSAPDKCKAQTSTPSGASLEKCRKIPKLVLTKHRHIPKAKETKKRALTSQTLLGPRSQTKGISQPSNATEQPLER